MGSGPVARLLGLLRDDRPLWREPGRVLGPGRRVVALVHEPGARPGLAELAAEAGPVVRRTVEVSLSGAHPLIVVLNPSP
ncbi:hypothetical protein [Sphaerisporangium sp. NPDC051011]|uniref:hypothetical protein n=1 Tax=Sphaerisporangium sp. NPDC051011 TaxID=3155792 RepID=UPI0033FD665D